MMSKFTQLSHEVRLQLKTEPLVWTLDFIFNWISPRNQHHLTGVSVQGSSVSWLWCCLRGAPYPAPMCWYPSNESLRHSFVYASQSSTFHWWPAFTLYLTACKWMLCDSERISCRRARSRKETRLSPACKRQKNSLSSHMNSSIVFVRQLGLCAHIPMLVFLTVFNLQPLPVLCPLCPTFGYSFLMDAEISWRHASGSVWVELWVSAAAGGAFCVACSWFEMRQPNHCIGYFILVKIHSRVKTSDLHQHPVLPCEYLGFFLIGRLLLSTPCNGQRESQQDVRAHGGEINRTGTASQEELI